MSPPSAVRSRQPLREASLREALIRPDAVWTELAVVDRTGSTNADLAAAARSGGPAGRILVAEEQTTGRGRLDRTWSAPPRTSITASVLLATGARVPDSRLGWLPLLTGVALVEAVARVASVDAALKWPNDLLVRATGPAAGAQGRATLDGYGKCAGVLAEVASHGLVVVGFGLNVSQRADELPPSPASATYPPTSLALAGGADTDREQLLQAVLGRLAEWYGRWTDAAGDADACGLRQAYRGVCATLGRMVEVLVPGGDPIRGRAAEIDVEGRLVLTTVDGERAVAAGDVVHVR